MYILFPFHFLPSAVLKSSPSNTFHAPTLRLIASSFLFISMCVCVYAQIYKYKLLNMYVCQRSLSLQQMKTIIEYHNWTSQLLHLRHLAQ